MSSRVLELAGIGGLVALRAISSEMRLRILMLLVKQDMNIQEMADALGLSQPSVTRHINVLEEAGLVRAELSSGIQGLQKRCHLCYDRLAVVFECLSPDEEAIEEVEMPIGLYTLAHARPTCGLANRERVIWWDDEPQAFFHPDRGTAQILWMAEGFVEYVFPNTLPSATQVHRLELVMEVCSETRNYNNDHPSDITVWINGVDIGTWTAPGDMGGRRGRLNPDWWHDHNTQHGFLTDWSIDNTGVSVDGRSVSETTLDRLLLMPQHPITVRIGVKPEAEHPGGFNLFGRGFGNHDQDLILRMHYTGTPLPKTSRMNKEGSQASSGHERVR